MLNEVVKQAMVFFLLYLLIILAFTSSFFILDPPENEQTFLGTVFYSYLLSLGEFGDMEWDIYYAPILFQLFFILSTLLVLIVMLNILIALVSKAYEEIMETKMRANDFERAGPIATLAPTL